MDFLASPIFVYANTCRDTDIDIDTDVELDTDIIHTLTHTHTYPIIWNSFLAFKGTSTVISKLAELASALR